MCNRYSIDLHSLIDSRANGFAFINTLFAIKTTKFLDTKFVQLKCPILVKGFDGEQGNTITHVLILHLTIDRRQQENLPFCILDLENYNVIFGLK